MKPERWQKIRRICEDALERKAGDREAFLRIACAGDDPLRAEVDSFLSGATGTDDFIETPAIQVAAKGMTEDAAHRAVDLQGATFLHYRITEKIGAGGMGEVYRAHDDRLKRDVAIKVLPDIFTDDPDRLARFDREATLLASLNHPNVATSMELSRPVQNASSCLSWWRERRWRSDWQRVRCRSKRRCRSATRLRRDWKLRTRTGSSTAT